MSYKSLLFCPDEATARLVTQVLSELEFTVELSFEPFVTVKKLEEEHFDALVVDCNDEQNAAVLFKGARNSTLNHSSLCVAVVEGQAGLAKAFRIGANLVLTRPINVEQSKNTLRVARGLLRKNTSPTKPAASADSAAETTIAPVPTASTPQSAERGGVTQPQVALPAPAPAGAATSTMQAAGFSSIEIEKEKTPDPDAEDAAVLESLPDLTIAKFPAKSASTPAVAFAASSSGQAAAPALAPEKKNVTEIRPAAPLATYEPIFAETKIPERTEHVEPMFSSYAPRVSAQRPVGSKSFMVTVCLLIAAAAGFFAWQKYQPMQYVHLPITASHPDEASPTQPSTSDNKPSPVTNNPALSQPDASSGVSANPGPSSQASSTQGGSTQPQYSGATSPVANNAPEGFPTKERIDVGDPADAAEPVITVVPKPKPLQVNNKSLSSSKTKQLDQPAPPALNLPATSASDSTLSGLISTNAALPKAGAGTLQVSQGVTQGLLIKRVAPAYPMSALQMRKQGTVELLASISKTGAITAVKVLSGDASLAKAAADAVKQWQYRPYLLNGEPVEIETQITVKFSLPR